MGVADEIGKIPSGGAASGMGHWLGVVRGASGLGHYLWWYAVTSVHMLLFQEGPEIQGRRRVGGSCSWVGNLGFLMGSWVSVSSAAEDHGLQPSARHPRHHPGL